MSDPIREAARRMAERMRIFRRYSQAEAEIGNTPFWDASDEDALQAYDAALLEVSGAVPLPFGEAV